MQHLTDQAQQTISELAQRHGISTDAVTCMLQALITGNGSMAQFNHRELGGSGQWMRGGMTLVGDMFNHGLKAKVDALCNDLSQLLAQQPFGTSSPSNPSSGRSSMSFPPMPGPSGNWWPDDLGRPSSSGGQNEIRYAYFPTTRRLAVEHNGHVTIYDTLDHQIGGVAQQQASGASLTFTSQHGMVSVASLPVVSIDGVTQKGGEKQAVPDPAPKQADAPPTPTAHEDDIFAKIERLAELQRKGIISPEEFASKKTDLLGRL